MLPLQPRGFHMIALWLWLPAAGACFHLANASIAAARSDALEDGSLESFAARPAGNSLPLMRSAANSNSLEPSARETERGEDTDGEAELLGSSQVASVKLHSPGDEPLEHQLALLAKQAFYLAPSTPAVAGWKLEAQLQRSSIWLPGTDYLSLWRKEKMCTLVFAPTDQLTTWTTQSQEHLDVPACGLKQVHQGFFSEFQVIVGEAQWSTTFLPKLSGAECSGGTLVVGHGFGGAVATIYAACASKIRYTNASGITIPPLFLDGRMAERDFHTNLPGISGLYTFGAPGVSHEQIQNANAWDTSFAGARFFLQDEAAHDPIPNSGYAQGWVHPKLAAVRLKEEHSGWVNRVEFMAATDSALKEPSAPSNPNMHLHEIDKYIERLKAAPEISGISRPGTSAVTAIARGGHATNTLTSTLYGVAGVRSGEPEPDREPIMVGDRSWCAAKSLIVGGAFLAMHSLVHLI